MAVATAVVTLRAGAEPVVVAAQTVEKELGANAGMEVVVEARLVVLTGTRVYFQATELCPANSNVYLKIKLKSTQTFIWR